MKNEDFVGKQIIFKWNNHLDGLKYIREEQVIFLIVGIIKISEYMKNVLKEEEYFNNDDIKNINKKDLQDYFVCKKISGYHEDNELNNDLLFMSLGDIGYFKGSIM